METCERTFNKVVYLVQESVKVRGLPLLNQPTHLTVFLAAEYPSRNKNTSVDKKTSVYLSSGFDMNQLTDDKIRKQQSIRNYDEICFTCDKLQYIIIRHIRQVQTVQLG